MLYARDPCYFSSFDPNCPSVLLKVSHFIKIPFFLLCSYQFFITIYQFPKRRSQAASNSLTFWGYTYLYLLFAVTGILFDALYLNYDLGYSLDFIYSTNLVAAYSVITECFTEIGLLRDIPFFEFLNTVSRLLKLLSTLSFFATLFYIILVPFPTQDTYKNIVNYLVHYYTCTILMFFVFVGIETIAFNPVMPQYYTRKQIIALRITFGVNCICILLKLQSRFYDSNIMSVMDMLLSLNKDTYYEKYYNFSAIYDFFSERMLLYIMVVFLLIISNSNKETTITFDVDFSKEKELWIGII